ncbi:MAG: TadE/TadG family type IV pilus assembly protein [Limnohabitans sp.]
MTHRPTSRQRGVFTVITAIGAVLLVVILGFVVDGSRLMVIQGELQNATDACALAAAAELNGPAPAVTGATMRAAAAGSQVGGALNKKNFQAAAVGIFLPTDVKFSTSLNGTYVAASAAVSTTNYRFAQCTATHNGWINLFMGLVGLADDVPVAISKAGLQQTRKVCVLPLALNAITFPVPPKSPPKNIAVGDDVFSLIRIADFESTTLTKTSSQYKNLIENFGSCGVPTDPPSVPAPIGLDTDNTMSSDLGTALLNRYQQEINIGQSSRPWMAVPYVDATLKIVSWHCLQLQANKKVVYKGMANSSTSPCIASGIAGIGAIGPFAPVLLK